MKPFSIICKSCAARLKVTKASAVNQLLACPKCGTMIKVAPPKGWVAPVSQKPNESRSQETQKRKLDALPPNAAGAGKSSDSNFDFDDIDQLLAKPDQIKSAPQATPKPHPEPAQQSAVPVPQNEKRARPAKTTADPNSVSDSAPETSDSQSQPMLPNQAWESDKAKSQKRLVQILALVLGAIFVGGFTLALFNANREKPPMPIVERNATNTDNQNAETEEPDTDNSDSDPDSSAAESEPTEQTTDEVKNDPDLAQRQPKDPAPSPNSETEPVASTTDLPPELPAMATQLPTQTDSNPENPSQQSPLLPSPFRNSPTETPADVTPEPGKKPAGVSMVAKIDSQMGDLAGLLEESGTTLGDLRDVAFEASGQSIAGMPKYVIEKPGTMKSDLNRLKLNVGGMLFEDTPLPVVIRDLISISGVPITIDARALNAAGKDVNQSVSLTIQDTDLDTAMNRILVPLGITKQSDAVGLKLTVANSQELKPATYSLAEFAGLDEQAKKSFLAYIQTMIDPQAWVRADNPASVELQGNDIVAKCSADSHALIRKLVAKLKFANALTIDPANAEAIAQTRTRSGAITLKLDAPIETKQSIRQPIGSFLTKLQSKSGVTVIVDWASVAQNGWTPKTYIPGNIDEPTTGDIVKQLAQAMKLSVVAVDQNTILLTTVSQAAKARDIEVYSVAKLIAGKFDEHQLKEVFETTLGYQLRTEKYVYDANCQCFIVTASQSKQRQVEALLKRLEGI